MPDKKINAGMKEFEQGRMEDEMAFSEDMAMGMPTGQPEETEVMIMMAEGEQSDDEMFAQMAPTGDFSKNAMNRLVDATNKLLPLFDQTPDYPSFPDGVQQFPTDFVRVLGMFQGAINMAVDAGEIPEEMDFNMEDIQDDRSIMMLAGKISALAKNKDFKRFLENPPMEEEDQMEEEMTEEEEMGDDEMDALFASRV